jgi:hypothetical protein
MKTVRYEDCFDSGTDRIRDSLRTKLGEIVSRRRTQGLSEHLALEAVKWATATFLASESDSG